MSYAPSTGRSVSSATRGLEAGERGAEAMVDAVTECEVSGRVPGDVEAVGAIPPSFVAVRRREEQQALAARGQGHPVQGDVTGEEAGERLGARVEAEHLFHRDRDAVGVGEQQRPLFGERVQPEDRVPDELRRRLVAGDEQQEAEAEDLAVGEVGVAVVVPRGARSRGRRRARRVGSRAGRSKNA